MRSWVQPSSITKTKQNTEERGAQRRIFKTIYDLTDQRDAEMLKVLEFIA
jgi:hypothetical protein